jgi:RNA polymerase sigma-70 factor (ECF subfamily)
MRPIISNFPGLNREQIDSDVDRSLMPVTGLSQAIGDHKASANHGRPRARTDTGEGKSMRPKDDSELLRTLHDEYAPALFSYVVGLTNGDWGRAQDIVQETLFRAWRNPAMLERRGGSGRSWLFTVAKRIVIDQWRSAARRPELLTAQVAEQPVEDTAQQTVDRQIVLAALRTLSIEHRRTVLEIYFRDASSAEAAKTLGVPPGTVKSRTHYALHALRQAIEGTGGVVA